MLVSAYIVYAFHLRYLCVYVMCVDDESYVHVVRTVKQGRRVFQ